MKTKYKIQDHSYGGLVARTQGDSKKCQKILMDLFDDLRRAEQSALSAETQSKLSKQGIDNIAQILKTPFPFFIIKKGKLLRIDKYFIKNEILK